MAPAGTEPARPRAAQRRAPVRHRAARPLSNLSLVWMLERAEACGLPLPERWRAEFPTDPTAPSVGSWIGWGKLFLLRKRRIVGRDRSERLHDSVMQRDMSRADGRGEIETF